MLDSPIGHGEQISSGGTLPFVPAGHALKPDGSEASMLDPVGTTTATEPPAATTCPGSTSLQMDCCGLDWRYPAGQGMHLVLPVVSENVPGEQTTQETDPVLFVYVPF